MICHRTCYFELDKYVKAYFMKSNAIVVAKEAMEIQKVGVSQLFPFAVDCLAFVALGST